MPCNTGKPSQKIFEDHWKALGKRAHCFEFYDQAEARGRAVGPFASNVRKQPSDYIVTVEGDTFFAEVKSTNNPNGAGLNLKKKSQIAYSRMIESAGGKYYYFIHNLLTNRWYRVEAREFTTLLKWSWLEREHKNWEVLGT